MLSDRQQKILRILESQPQSWIRGREIAKMLNVSDRTIRTDIDIINKSFPAAVIASNRHKGYALLDKSQKPMKPFDREHETQKTPEERVNFIIRKLLFHENEQNLSNLSDELFVSEYSLENDLRRVRVKLKEYTDIHIRLLRSKNFIHLEGSEVDKRKLYKQLLDDETKDNFINMDKIAALYKEFDLLKMKHILDETLQDHNFHVREMLMPMLMIHIGICIERLLHHNYVSTNVKKDMLINTPEYEIASEFFRRIHREIHVEIVDDEITRLALLLMGKRNNRFRSEDIILDTCNLPLQEIVDELLQNTFERFDIDMRYDTDLKIGLEVHLQGVVERMHQGVKIGNVYLQETKRNYPLVFEMAVWCGEFLSARLGHRIDENEIGFLTLHLGTAYERSSSSHKYRALMIYPDEQVLSKMCYQKIANRFYERMDIVGHINVYEQKRVLEYDPDLIITTLPLHHDLPIPTIKISLFFNNNDESTLFYALNDLDSVKNHDEFEDFIKEIMFRDLFYVGLKAAAPEDVIDHMCHEMEKKDLIPEAFRDSVLERESFSSTSIVYGLAIPHALSIAAKRSCISVALLEKPIQWGTFEVSLVILLGIREEDKRLMSIFFEWLSRIVSDNDKFAHLLEAKGYDDFIAAIE